MLIVQICDFGSDGDARYRLHDPSRYMGRLPGITAVDSHYFSRHLPDLADIADVLVLQFVNDWDLLSLCVRRRAAGRITVFEANDYFFDLQPWNPIAGAWQDRNVQELFSQLLEQADAVQTSTEGLARRWRERGARQVAVFPNHLSSVPPLAPPPDRPLTIGWAGSPGHLADWYYLAPALQRWLDSRPQTRLAVMTHEAARPFFRLAPERYQFEPFASLEKYLNFLGGVDIGIAPLLPTEYNRGRSDVKFLEYASQGVAGIYADMEPYQTTVVRGETGLLFRTPAELVEQLDCLCTNPELRLKLRNQGYAYASQRRLIVDHIGQRIDWYRGLLKLPARTEPLPAEISNDAICDGGYVQLPARDPERMFVQAIGKPTIGDPVSLLKQLLQKCPRFLLARENLARILNDRRDPRGATACLEQAKSVRSDSSRTFGEMGRAWFLLNDPGRAREALEEALRINPHYLPAWQYLLRLFDWKRSSDGPAWAQRAEAHFPNCYPVALLGVRTHKPENAVPELLRILERHAPTLTWNERPTAINLFRDAVLATAGEAPPGPKTLLLLRRASELFPESARLAGAYGTALFQAGCDEESIEQHVRALALRRNAIIDHAECPREEPIPFIWQLAHHIRAAMGESGDQQL